MKNLSVLNDTKTMSSLEISTLTGKRHADVLRDIRVTMAQLAELCDQDANNYVNKDLRYLTNQGVTINYCPQTKRAESYSMHKREWDLVVSGYSVKYRLAIIDRWQALESQQAMLIPQSFSQALRIAADVQEKLELAQLKIQLDEPKVHFATIVSEDGNTRCVRIWVKAMKHENNLTVGEQEVFKWLLNNRYIYKDKSGYLPYSKYEANGSNYFTVVIDEINGKPRRQLKITGRGVVALTSKVVSFFNFPRLSGEAA